MIGNRPDCGHGLRDTHREPIKPHEFRCLPVLALLAIPSLFQNLIHCAHLLAGREESSHCIADVPPGFFVGCPAARHVERRDVGNVRLILLEEVRSERKISHVVRLLFHPMSIVSMSNLSNLGVWITSWFSCRTSRASRLRSPQNAGHYRPWRGQQGDHIERART